MSVSGMEQLIMANLMQDELAIKQFNKCKHLINFDGTVANNNKIREVNLEIQELC